MNTYTQSHNTHRATLTHIQNAHIRTYTHVHNVHIDTYTHMYSVHITHVHITQTCTHVYRYTWAHTCTIHTMLTHAAELPKSTLPDSPLGGSVLCFGCLRNPAALSEGWQTGMGLFSAVLVTSSTLEGELAGVVSWGVVSGPGQPLSSARRPGTGMGMGPQGEDWGTPSSTAV